MRRIGPGGRVRVLAHGQFVHTNDGVQIQGDDHRGRALLAQGQDLALVDQPVHANGQGIVRHHPEADREDIRRRHGAHVDPAIVQGEDRAREFVRNGRRPAAAVKGGAVGT